jgi:uncharacterized protein involved in exopolysaccharide biosynthesis
MSLLDVLVALANRKHIVIVTTLAFTVFGVVYSLVVAEEYTTEAKVVREAQQEAQDLGSIGGLGALQGLGINLGGAGSGLSTTAFPNVLQSREVRLAVVQDTFYFPDLDRSMRYIDYVNRPSGFVATILKYTVRLPWTIKGALFDGSPQRTDTASTSASGTIAPTLPSKEVDRALKSLEGKYSVSVDNESGLMTISVTTEDPRLSTEITNSLIHHFTNRVREIRTQKVTERLKFVRGRFQEAEEELETVEEELAQFLERNQNPTTAYLQFQRDRLQRQVTFKEQLYSEIQSQLTKTRLELQRRQPVLTVVEKPVPPLQRSWPSRTMIVIVSVIFGVAAGIGLALIVALVTARTREDEKKKLSQIGDQIVPGSARRWLAQRSESLREAVSEDG